MRYPKTWAEDFAKSLSQLVFSIEELDRFIKIFQRESKRKFDFKKEGLCMTAVEFFQYQKQVKECLAALRKRRREILREAKL